MTRDLLKDAIPTEIQRRSDYSIFESSLVSSGRLEEVADESLLPAEGRHRERVDRASSRARQGEPELAGCQRGHGGQDYDEPHFVARR